MDFMLNEDQRLVQATVREMALAEIAPRAKEADRNHRLDPKVLSLLTELGLWGGAYGEEWGGSGLDYLSYILAVEELSRACASTGVLLAAHSSLCCDPIHHFGTAAQKERFLRPLLAGEKIGCFLLTEAGAGSDVGALGTKFEDRGDHYWVNGSKQFITNGGYLGTGVLFATRDKTLGNHGLSAFVLDLTEPGVSLLKNEEKLGIRASYTSAFALDGVKLPKDRLLGQPDQGFKIAMETLNGGRISIAAQALGIGQAALDLAVNYARDRKQFGQALQEFQGIQFKLAEMTSRLEAARLMTYKAAWSKGGGHPSAQASAMAKLLASEAANFCADQSLQIHGGYGYSAECEVERLYRDARITEIYEGTSEIQKIVIAKGLFKG
ncbi:MAG: acyl-CoA dehydrogenase [Candidatus Lambdaproteobacteria bacterium RIFOXYD1_FULL_56_27]|uniref:3-sulfinopropanoyl-CoA desulfinase n=1 Tax=Candidatus Lambdaproteobacteria bacterium RIFOXYD2_FULL_56_26 TaxID=1817773 RepID=A0A1F6GZL4_9PROT|nr:MAG: acyl-CoA dehydrogenase [Candidatus Lambdaproteobacteria bacterium RIFOXYC1_FULL_56_13]OGH03606.1 MAG: acyl-CoA dehydrogenase [Candidatus Lambdaproteobacteria bacterium RIFOXYD2_FULL_56_26]OGH06792.1 MAG: acyl-CoA dehydrogenase [Candidatus Lambdaproteobacteria bacterium RIFOXYD1_FULL_56_27]